MGQGVSEVDDNRGPTFGPLGPSEEYMPIFAALPKFGAGARVSSQGAMPEPGEAVEATTSSGLQAGINGRRIALDLSQSTAPPIPPTSRTQIG